VIQKCDTINELYLSNNEIENDGAKFLAQILKERKNFKNIDLDNNKFGGEAITDLFKVLPLTKLNLIKNVLSEE